MISSLFRSLIPRHTVFGLICVLVGVLCCTPLAAQELLISQRIGTTIDSLERVYFNLFPGVDGAISATAVSDVNNTVRFIVHRDSGKSDTLLVVPDSIAADLQRYVDHYEGMFQGDTIRLDWWGLSSIARPSRPYKDDPVGVKVTTRDGKRISGTLVYSNDSVMVVSTSRSNSVLPPNDTTAHVFHVRQIARIEDNLFPLAHLIIEMDFFVGGNDTLYRQFVRPRLQLKGVYPFAPPPELSGHIVHELASISAPLPRPDAIETVEDLFAPERLHVYGALGTAVLRSRATANSIISESGQTVTGYVRVPDPDYLYCSASYSILEWLRIGGGYAIHSPTDFPEDTLVTAEHASYSSTIDVGVQLVLLRRGMWLQDFFRRLEVHGGIGMAIRSIDFDQRIVSPYASVVEPYGIRQTSSQTLTGVTLVGGVDYYPNRTLSFEVRWRSLFFPQVEIQELVLPNRFREAILRKSPAHTLTFDSIDMLFGLHIHL